MHRKLVSVDNSVEINITHVQHRTVAGKLVKWRVSITSGFVTKAVSNKDLTHEIIFMRTLMLIRLLFIIRNLMNKYIWRLRRMKFTIHIIGLSKKYYLHWAKKNLKHYNDIQFLRNRSSLVFFFINKNIDITFADSIMHTEKTTLYFSIVNVDVLS